MSDNFESGCEAPQWHVGDNTVIDDELLATVFLDGKPYGVSTDAEEINRLLDILDDGVEV